MGLFSFPEADRPGEGFPRVRRGLGIRRSSGSYRRGFIYLRPERYPFHPVFHFGIFILYRVPDTGEIELFPSYLPDVFPRLFFQGDGHHLARDLSSVRLDGRKEGSE